MHYQTIYDIIISNAQYRPKKKAIGYDLHHVIPKSCGGTNDKSNLVSLTYREHYICHMILVKLYEDTQHKHKMAHALWRLSLDGRNRARTYAYARLKHIETLKARRIGSKQSQETKDKIRASLLGRKHDAERRDNMRLGNAHRRKPPKEKMPKVKAIPPSWKGRKQSQEHIDKRVNKQLGQKRTPEQCARMKIANIRNAEIKKGIHVNT
jgi:hypothetical protein